MNDVSVWLRYLFVLVHVFALVVALGAVLREDFKFLLSKTPRIDLEQLRQVSRVVFYALGVLWISGLALIAIDTGADANTLASPKLMAKLIVVITLTANGVVLHRVLMPMLSTPESRSMRAATLFSVVGAISMVSWFYAACLGVAKPLAPILGFGAFIGVYAVLLMGAIGVALTVMRPRVERLLDTIRPVQSAPQEDRYADFTGPMDLLSQQ